MKVLELRDTFGLNNLKFTTRAMPTINSRQVLIKIKAISLNYRDILMVKGQYNPRQALPLIPCSDAVGEVVEIGSDVGDFKIGDRVIPLFAPRWMDGPATSRSLKQTLGGPLDGTMAQFMAVDSSAIIAAPAYLGDLEAATLPCAALTAWHALIEQGQIKPGDDVLILGTGGVAIFALFFAKLAGARVIITSSNNDKLARAQQLGADAIINYVEHPGWGKVARDITNGCGVDHVLEVGGAGTIGQSLKALKPSGTISLIGVLAGGAQKLNIVPILMQNVRVQGIFVGNKSMFQSMNRALCLHGIKPVVDKVFAFDDALQAFHYLEGASHIGKVCIQFDD